MKITQNIHDYFMAQTFMFRGNLVKDGIFDNNNIVVGRNLGLDFEIHFKHTDDFNYMNEIYVTANSEEEKMLRKFSRITNFIRNKSLYDNEMIPKLRHIAQKMNRVKRIAK